MEVCHYEKEKYDFFQGEHLQNIGGGSYLLVEKYSNQDLLLMNEKTGEFVVGIGTQMFSRYPQNEMPTKENTEHGIEWGHGRYLGCTPSRIDFERLRNEFCSMKKEGHDVYDVEIREVLSRVQKIEADSVAEAVDKAEEMYHNEEVVLDSEDYRGVDYVPVLHEEHSR